MASIKKSVPITPWIVLFFFFSGLAGLIYEIIWVRELTIYTGGGAFSVSIVLTVFMGGLALGSGIAAKILDRIKNTETLIFIYGMLELTIGLYALIFGALLSLLRPVYSSLYGLLIDHYLCYNTTSGLLSAIILLLPTTLMGATLPILCRFYVTSISQSGSKVGFLYGINTLGGALGALSCGFVLIRFLGMNGTLFLAVMLNGGIGLSCLLYARNRKTCKIVLAPGSGSPHTMRRSADYLNPVLLILVVSGFCAMAYEVIWTRLLALLMGPTTYSFTLVLFTFITGLALGSMLFGRLGDRVKNPYMLLIGSQLVAALSAMLVGHLLGNGQFYFAKLLFHFRNQAILGELAKALTVFLMMLIPTLCLGAVFPLTAKLVLKSVETVGSSVGFLYTLNTLGALLGSFCSGFILIPLLGMARSLSGIFLLQMSAAGVIWVLNKKLPWSTKWILLPVGAGLLLISFTMPRWNKAAFTQGRYQRFDYCAPFLENTSFFKALFSSDKLLDTSQQPEVLYMEEGIGGFTAVCQLVNSLGVTSRYLSNSGKIEASTLGDQSTMLLLSHLPMLIHPNAKDVLVIGLGSGITAGQILYYPVKKVDILEISPEVVWGAAYFKEWNNNILENPKSHIIVQDARTHVTLSQQTYDVITAEPSNIWMAGLANLFTRDYYDKIKKHLNPNGIYVQWFHAYQADWTVFSSIGHTFQQAFNNCVLFRSSLSLGDFLFVGFNNENDQIRPEILQKNTLYLKNSNHLRLDDPYVIYPLIVAENLKNLFADGLIHTDQNPILEYLAPYQMNTERSLCDETIKKMGRNKPSTIQIMQRFTEVENKINFADFITSLNNPPFHLVPLADLNEIQKQKFLKMATRFCENNLYPYPFINDATLLNLCLAIHESRITAHLSSGEAKPGSRGWIHFDLAKVYGQKKEYGKAKYQLDQALACLPEDFNILIYYAYACQEMKDYSAAIAMFNRLLQVYPKTTAVFKDLAECYLRNNDMVSAKTYIEKAMQTPPVDKRAADIALVVYLELKEWQKAIPVAQTLIQNNPGGSLYVYRSVALAFARDRQPQNALDYIMQGLALAPNDPVLLTIQERIAKTP